MKVLTLVYKIYKHIKNANDGRYDINISKNRGKYKIERFSKLNAE